ncbi:MAG TPA: BamA/TamA family outer membrane protein [Puia sp.]|nr:BamA/TamA family outer membrane protein [Puia sp.]
MILLSAVLAVSLFSCITIPRNYQPYKPFVFATNIKVEGNMSPGEKQDLASRLANQLDDSMRTQVISYAGIYKKLDHPPAYDTANVRRSIGYMVALLNAIGYFTPIIKDTSLFDTVRKSHPYKDQYRVTINFRIWPGKQLRLDSIGYSLQTPELQALALQNIHSSLLKKGDPYSKVTSLAEIDRLVALFKNNGYYKFSRQDLEGERDTVVSALIDPSLDPFQQAALMAELQRKREHPTIKLVFRQKPVRDSADLIKYTIGHVTVYPDLPVLLEDTVTVNKIDTSTARGFTIITRSDKFRPWVITDNIYLRPGALYQQMNYNRTISRFTDMGAWQQAFISLTPVDSADSILDALIRLYPAKKQYVSTDFEISRNTNDIVTSSNLFGIGVALGFRNRNSFKQSVFTTTSLRGGVELGDHFIQTTQASLAHTLSFPRQIAPDFIRQLFHYKKDSIRTLLPVSGSYTERHLSNGDLFFSVASVSTSFGWEWNSRNKYYMWNPINVEYAKLTKTDTFQRYLNNVPSLNLAFKSGLIVGLGLGQFVYKSVRKAGNHSDVFRFAAEESGALLGLIKTIDEGELWRFVKGDVDYTHTITWRKTQLAFHGFAGAGWAYGRAGSGFELTLPFYKAFFAGGPNSMRGWQIRQLGLGSSKFYDTANGGLIDRFGDVQLEGNVEYRFPLGTLFGVKLTSALYMDCGNIWNRHIIDSPATAKEASMGSDFKFDRFYNELAFDAGTGLRIEFPWLLIRFDYAYKIRDPQRMDHADTWFYDLSLFKGQFQLGVGYAF